MAGNLRARLARIRAGDGAAAPKDAPPKRTPGRGPFPTGWTTARDGLRVKATVSPPLGPAPSATLRLAAFSPRLADLEAAAKDLVFFDLETTGLSGGAGTIAFLAAVGRVREDGSFSVTQYFLDDYPAEPYLLEALEREFSLASAVVTYNGSSFDMPLYAVRRAMNGLGPGAPIPHVDALHASRRLWRRALGSCSLGAVESAALGVRRVDDVPGSEVPEVWFDYVKRGRTDRLERVFTHNEQDVRSLAALSFAIDGAVRDAPALPQVDPVGLAELQSRVEQALAERTLARALAVGDDRAVRPLMRLYRRQGRLRERAELVPSLPDDAAGLFAKSVYAERRARDLEAALRLARLAMEGSTGALRERAERRVKRLSLRIGQSSREGAEPSVSPS